MVHTKRLISLLSIGSIFVFAIFFVFPLVAAAAPVCTVSQGQCPESQSSSEAWGQCPSGYFLQAAGFRIEDQENNDVRVAYVRCWNPTTDAITETTGTLCKLHGNPNVQCPNWSYRGGPEGTASCSLGWVLKGVGFASSGGGNDISRSSWECYNPSTGQVTSTMNNPETFIHCTGSTEGLTAVGFSASGNAVTRASATCVGPVLAPKPDLTTQHTSITINGTLSVGNSISFTSTVKNQGSGSAAAGSIGRFCIDNSNCLNSPTGSLGETTFNAFSPGLVSGNRTSASWVATVGSHTVYWCADVTKIISETNESNNCNSRTFTVNAPANNLPKGAHDYTDNASCTVGGWTGDPDSPTGNIQARILSDGSTVWTGTASNYRSDLDNAWGASNGCQGGHAGF